EWRCDPLDGWGARECGIAREEDRRRLPVGEGSGRPSPTASGSNPRPRVVSARQPAGTKTHLKAANEVSQNSYIERIDPEIYSAIEGERRRQVEKIELIASENYTSPAVMEATGSVLTNKYAEGYPGRRYYGGCGGGDIAESLAVERGKALFGSAHADVQSHAGGQADKAASPG